jgi:hypothetical protein
MSELFERMIEYLKSNLKDLEFKQILDFFCKNKLHVTKVASSLLAGCVFYKTMLIYIKRRKYVHIPGPPTNGFEKKTVGFI